MGFVMKTVVLDVTGDLDSVKSYSQNMPFCCESGGAQQGTQNVIFSLITTVNQTS